LAITISAGKHVAGMEANSEFAIYVRENHREWRRLRFGPV